MENKDKIVVLPCDCKCCMFVAEKTKWADGSVGYNLSIQDSRYDHDFNTIWGRIKRAADALFGKPVYFSDVYIEDEEKFKKWIGDLSRLTSDD